MIIFDRLKNGKALFNKAIQESGEYTGLSEQMLRQLQMTLLEMFLDLEKVCKKYGLSVFLCGGSALGCVRHGGFIPWDDDLDVAMSRRDYRILERVFDEELGESYILNAPSCSSSPLTRFPKMLRRNTKYVGVGQKFNDNRSLVFLDIFLIDNIPNSPIKRKMKGYVVNFCEAASAQIDFKNSWEGLKDIYMRSNRNISSLKYFLGNMCSIVSGERWLVAIDRLVQYEDENSDYCGLCTGRKHYFGEILPRSAFFPGKKAVFEGHEVFLFEDVYRYLENLYGPDYMIPPPVEKRELHYVKEIEL